jgi:hypothetical protein
MSKGKLSHQYYLFSLSNLFAAFGGGLILGKGLGVINIPYLENASILAFFIGTIFGLAFLYCVPKKFSKLLSQYFSLCCAITSISLYFLFKSSSELGKISGTMGIAFFILLSIRFGFWFYSRVIRASNASGQEQSIAWVELGYYSGMILGLIFWKLFKIEIDLSSALIVDATFLLLSSLFDFKAYSLAVSASSKLNEQPSHIHSKKTDAINMKWLWKLATCVVFLTIGVQVIIFDISHQVGKNIGVYILGVFYGGVAFAAYIANKFKINLEWKKEITVISFQNKRDFQFSTLTFLLASIMLMMVLILNHSLKVNIELAVIKIFFLILVFAASFLYEIFCLSILDRIGYEEQILKSSGMIMKTYALMGLGASISLGMLGFLTQNNVNLILIIFCFSFITTLLHQRKTKNLNKLDASIA